VLEEVIDLFPAKYVHVGGDEAVKDQWEASKQVQQRMRALGIKDEWPCRATSSSAWRPSWRSTTGA
jgi:N-acetyl-beta-hexosaminidase